MADNNDNLEEALNNILGELRRQNDRQEKSDKKKENQEKEKKSKFNELKKGLTKQIPGVSEAIRKGTSQIEAAVKQSFELQKTALSRGMNLGQLMQRSADANNELAGKLTGAIIPVEIEMEKVAAGLGKSSAATDKLALMTKVTGGDSKKLLKQLGQLNMGVGMSVEQDQKLSNTIGSLTQNFGMTIDELMGTIQGLEKSMPMFKLLGIAPEIAEATARLGAALGQEAGNMASEVITAFTSAEGAVLASQLGVMNERNALLNKEGDTVAASMRMVEAAGQEANRMYESYLAGTGDPAIAYKAVEDALGPAMAKSALTYKQLEVQAKEQGKTVGEFLKEVQKQKQINDEFANTLDNFISTVFYPLEKAMMYVVEAITGIMAFFNNNKWAMVLVQVIVSLTVGIAGLAIAFGGISAVLVKFTAMFPGLMLMMLRALSNVGALLMKIPGASAVAGVAKAGVGKVTGLFGGKKGAAATGGGGVGGAASKAGGGAGKGLASLGKGIRGLGAGIGQGIGLVLKNIAKGIAAFGNPKVFKGILALGLVGLAMMPFGMALRMMKGIGFKEIAMLGAAMLIFGTLMAATGFFLGGALPYLLMGAVVFAIVGAALIPMAYALNLITEPLRAFSVVLATLGTLNPLQIALLGPALLSLSAGLVAMAAATAVGGFISFFTGGSNPIDKLIELGKHASELNKLAASFGVLAGSLDKLGPSLSKLKAEDVAKLAKAGKIASQPAAGLEYGKNYTVTSRADPSYKMTSTYTRPERIAEMRADAQRLRERGRGRIAERGAEMRENLADTLERNNALLERLVEQGGVAIKQRRQTQDTMEEASAPAPVARD